MRQSEEIGQLAAALSAVQGELADAPRSKQGHGYKYADLGAVLAEVRPALSRHGLAIVQGPGLLEQETRTVTVTSVLIHESGQWMETRSSAPVEQRLSRDGTPTMTWVQACGSVITYLRRYSLAALVGLTQVDDDGSYEPPTPVSRPTAERPAPSVTVPVERPATGQPAPIATEQAAAIWHAAKHLWPDDPRMGIVSWLEANGFPVRSSDLSSSQAGAVIIRLADVLAP
jgi:hypothetical protein